MQGKKRIEVAFTLRLASTFTSQFVHLTKRGGLGLDQPEPHGSIRLLY